MKVSDKYITREIAGEIVVVPTGEAAEKIEGMITMNPCAEFIWRLMKDDISEEAIVSAVINEFNVDDETAKRDVHGLLTELLEVGMITE